MAKEKKTPEKIKPPLWRAIGGPVLRILLGVFIGLTVFLLFFQSIYIYRPDGEIVLTPGVSGLAYENVSFSAQDGVRLHGWFIPARDGRATVLYHHPNFGNVSFFTDSLVQLNRMGLSVLAFDYRGFGKSEGRPSEEGTALDALAAYDWLRREKGGRPLIIWGRSLGAAVAARLASERESDALILEAPFSSFPDVAADFYPYLPVRLIARFQYPTVDYVARVKCPLLIVASRTDEVIGFDHAERVFAAAHEPKTLLAVEGGHNDFHVVSAGVYEKGIDEFIARVSSSPASSSPQ